MTQSLRRSWSADRHASPGGATAVSPRPICTGYVFDQAELGDFVAQSPALFPPGFNETAGLSMVGPEAIPRIGEGLARDNLTDQQIGAILGESWLRIARRVWK